MHIKNGKNENMFITPRIIKTDATGKNPVVLNDISGGGSALALGLSYVIEVMAYTNAEKDNRLENKTARENARIVADALKAGDMGDLFGYHVPAGLTPSGDIDSKWTDAPVMKASRKDLIHACNLLIKADDILGKAEASVKEIAVTAGFSVKVDGMPVYGTGTGGRAKRASGGISI